ncbi:MAG TPA: hypothetical protein VFJ77_08325 [Gaiellaceae bacterium]|nr:hypothetical protein [Gaiellaceae bacterium]
MIDVEPLIVSELERMLPLPDGHRADWADVVGRARGLPGARRDGRLARMFPARRWQRRLLAGATAAAVALVSTAFAFGWPQSLIDFLGATPAPKPIKNDFGRSNVIAPPKMSPRVIPGQARRIMSATWNRRRHVLYVAPTRSGGFCYVWTQGMGSCSKPSLLLGGAWLGSKSGGASVVSGYVLAGKAKTLQARFLDGSTARIRVSWVSAPIKAGFFLYIVPGSHQTPKNAVTSVVALDAHGQVVAQQFLPVEAPLDRQEPKVLPDGTRVSLSARAEAAKAKKIISFRASNGSRVWLWAMPSRGGGHCYVYNQGFGCIPAEQSKQTLPVADGLSIGTGRVLYFAQTTPKVAVVELHYQDGSVEQLKPREGFILHEIGPAHYPLGHRLTKAVGLDSQGHLLTSHPFTARTPGIYPCKKPLDRGYGVKSCP